MKYRGLFIFIILSGVFFLSASQAFAIPPFARKYNLSCGSCHTKPPRLNRFGEAFHMAGFQIPMVHEGESLAKRKIGQIMSETHFLNIFGVRTTGDLLYSDRKQEEFSILFPQKVVFYLAGSITNGLSYFFELEQEREESSLGIGDEFFFMMNIPSLARDIHGTAEHGTMRHDSGAMIHGPMIMVGKIDPSTNFSYPTNRQIIANLPGRVNSDTDSIERLSFAPYAFASKFSGLMTTEGKSVGVTQPVLYNTTGDFGIDAHMMIGPFLFSTGVMQGLESGSADYNAKKDPYLMGRVNFGGTNYFSGSLSGLLYRGFDTARLSHGANATTLVGWTRKGVAGNIQYRFFDLYGAYIWDTLRDLPAGLAPSFQNQAAGFTIEGDYYVTNKTLLSLRYDGLKSGGSQTMKSNLLTAQARYYLRDNFSFYARESYEYEESPNLFKSLTVIGLDFDF